MLFMARRTLQPRTPRKTAARLSVSLVTWPVTPTRSSCGKRASVSPRLKRWQRKSPGRRANKQNPPPNPLECPHKPSWTAEGPTTPGHAPGPADGRTGPDSTKKERNRVAKRRPRENGGHPLSASRPHRTGRTIPPTTIRPRRDRGPPVPRT